jgi:hypothetical protein
MVPADVGKIFDEIYVFPVKYVYPLLYNPVFATMLPEYVLPVKLDVVPVEFATNKLAMLA